MTRFNLMRMDVHSVLKVNPAVRQFVGFYGAKKCA